MVELRGYDGYRCYPRFLPREVASNHAQYLADNARSCPRERRGSLMSMFREHGLPWKLVGFFSLALAPPDLRWAQAEQVPQGLDEALSGQVAVKPQPKRETPRIMLPPEFWSPSPSQSDFIRELRETETTKLPSADTPYPEADPNASNFRSKNPPLSPDAQSPMSHWPIRLPGRASTSDANRSGRKLSQNSRASRKMALPRGRRRSPRRA